MGGARIDYDSIKKAVSNQPRTFTVDDIARETQISIASAYKVVNDLVATGAVILDHKQGKKKIYAVSGQGSSDGIIKPNITNLTPVERFDHVSMIVDMVAQGISPSALVTGLSGIGKTHLVLKRLKENGLIQDDDFVMVKGHSSAQGLYSTLYHHCDQTVIFDDCDSIFKDAISVNLLKAALDSYETRRLSWMSTRLPDDIEGVFDFTGNIIFISNMTADRIDEAVKSRTFVVDLQMSRKEICEYMRTILDDLEPDMEMESKVEVLDEIEARSNTFEQFNIRTFIKACRVYRSASMTGRDWKKSLTVLI